MDTLLRALARLVAGRSYVFQPMARRYRFNKIVKCPETDQAAEVLVNAYPGTVSTVKKKPSSIRNCSLWPSRRGCTRSCLEQVAERSRR